MNTTPASASNADWRPGAAQDTLRARARLNADIRAFFSSRGVLEVETPLLCSSTATDLHLTSLEVTDFAGRGAAKYLQTSPEFAMKRLLAAGSGPIYQLCKSFRAGDIGDRHNPEFTMLEWYRPGFTLTQLMDEVAALLLITLGDALTFTAVAHASYRALFESHYGINPHTATADALRALVAARTSFGDASSLDAPACLDLLFATGIEPGLGHDCPLFVSGFPVAQAALAQVGVDAAGDRVAMRCEVYVRGMELANGYAELTDAIEQRRRFADDNRRREAAGLPAVPPDERLLAALTAGLPACSGVALGVDRLLMLRAGLPSLDAALTFSANRA